MRPLWLAVPLAALILLHLFLIVPRTGKKKRRGLFLGRLYAHRGLYEADGAPENSMAAFRCAVKHKCAVEADVRLSADGVPVVFHDESLARMCGIERRTENLSAAALTACTLADTKETIPTLRDVVTLIGNRVPLMVHLMGEAADTALCDTVLPLLENAGTDYCVCAEEPALLARFRRIAPDVVRVLLVPERGTQSGMRGFLLRSLLENRKARPDIIAAHTEDGGRYPIRLCRTLGAAVMGGIITDREGYTRVKKRFDAYICENIPELLRKPKKKKE